MIDDSVQIWSAMCAIVLEEPQGISPDMNHVGAVTPPCLDRLFLLQIPGLRELWTTANAKKWHGEGIKNPTETKAKKPKGLRKYMGLCLWRPASGWFMTKATRHRTHFPAAGSASTLSDLRLELLRVLIALPAFPECRREASQYSVMYVCGCVHIYIYIYLYIYIYIFVYIFVYMAVFEGTPLLLVLKGNKKENHHFWVSPPKKDTPIYIHTHVCVLFKLVSMR